MAKAMKSKAGKDVGKAMLAKKGAKTTRGLPSMGPKGNKKQYSPK